MTHPSKNTSDKRLAEILVTLIKYIGTAMRGHLTPYQDSPDTIPQNSFMN
jgi:hypothetical protein